MVADAVALGCVNFQLGGPAITNDDGLSCWQEGPNSSFTGVQNWYYWQSEASILHRAVARFLYDAQVYGVSESQLSWVWPVRGGG